MPRTMRHATLSRSAIFAPLGDVGRATRVEQRLADAIRSGLLADGERLPSEQELASMLGVAVVTAREALVALRARGLVTTSRGRGGGSFVTRPGQADDRTLSDRLAQMTRVELRDRGALYRVILTGSAEMAAEFADAADTDALRELLVAVDNPDVARWRSAGAELHLSVAALSQSARMTRAVMRHEADFGVLARLPLAGGAFRAATHRHHGELVDAISSRDPDRARRAVRDQVDEAIGSLVDIHRTVR